MSKDSITYEGSTVEELTADFKGAVDDYLALCEEKGIEPSDKQKGNSPRKFRDSGIV